MSEAEQVSTQPVDKLRERLEWYRAGCPFPGPDETPLPPPGAGSRPYRKRDLAFDAAADLDAALAEIDRLRFHAHVSRELLAKLAVIASRVDGNPTTRALLEYYAARIRTEITAMLPKS